MLCFYVYGEWDWANGSRSGHFLKSVSLQWAMRGLDLWLGLGVGLCKSCSTVRTSAKVAPIDDGWRGRGLHISAASRLLQPKAVYTALG